MVRKTNEIALAELKGPERVFQIDRDTLIIYTGREKGDLRPFIRIGAGMTAPSELLRHIETVVLPDEGLWNMGVEMAWLDATLSQGVNDIRYLGSKDKISQLYSYTGFQQVEQEMEDKSAVPVHFQPYKSPREVVPKKDNCVINFLDQGNLGVYINGSRVLDLTNYKKSRIHLDKEYEYISKSLSKRKQKCVNGFGMVFLGSNSEFDIPTYWNFNGTGLLLNPLPDYHYAFFEHSIDPGRVAMAISSSSYGPGFVEAIRRKDLFKESIGVYIQDPEHLINLKKLYMSARITPFDDSRTLPAAKDTVFFVSRGGAYGLFSLKLKEKAETNVQILFPIGVTKKINKTFEYIKGPHDLQLAVISDRKDLHSGQDARLRLHVPGNIKIEGYLRTHLREGDYPLVPVKEYIFHYTDSVMDVPDLLLAGLKGTPFEKPMRDLVMLCTSTGFESEQLQNILLDLKKQGRPKDLILRNNIFEIFRFIRTLPLYQDGFDRLQKRTMRMVQMKYSLSGIRVRDWLALSFRDIEFHVLFYRGKDTFLIAVALEPEIMRFEFPPAIDNVIFEQKNYAAVLKQQGRFLDKAMDPPGYRPGLEFMEKLFDFRVYLSNERRRLNELMIYLGILEQEKERNPIIEKSMALLPKGVRSSLRKIDLSPVLDKIRVVSDPLRDRFRYLKAALWF